MRKAPPFYNKLKLQTKFTITHLLIATIPMLVLGIFFYVKLYDMIIADTIRTEQNNSAQTAPLIDNIVDSVKQTSKNAIKAAKSSQPAELEDALSNLIDGNFITDIRIYLNSKDSEERLNGYTKEDSLLPLSCAKGTYWYGIFQGNPTANSLFCPSFYLSSNEIAEYGELAYIVRSYVLIDEQLKSCYTAVYYSKDYLTSLLSDNISVRGSVAYLINERDSIVATSDDSLAGAYHFSYNSIQQAFMFSNDFIERQILGQNVYAGFYNIQEANWYMVVVLPAAPVIEKAYGFLLLFVAIYILCIIIAFIAAYTLSHSITHRLTSVINQMSNVRFGPPVPLPASQEEDEIGDMINNYNHMTTMINALLETQAKAAEELRIAEFNALQAQINPHFLYNTMDMINWLSQQGKTDEVTMAIQNLSRFYKLTLSRKKETSTIADEIEHISIYIKLQNMRFHDNIDFIVDIPDELVDYPIPKLTFQPIVENAILHGILESEEKKGSIVLTGWIEEDDIVIVIFDDGVGMTESTLKNILSGDTKSRQGSSIGIYNTHQRLQLLYGEKYGLTYSSTLGRGTEVQIRIPMP